MSTLRTGKRDIDNLKLGTAEKLYEYAKAHLDQVGCFLKKYIENDCVFV